jgi:hypothetical protein
VQHKSFASQETRVVSAQIDLKLIEIGGWRQNPTAEARLVLRDAALCKQQ